MTTTFEVHTRLVAEHMTASGPTEVLVGWTWTPADPFSVELRFMTGRTDAKDVRWLVARDLLIDGLEASVGIGDVRVRPENDQPGLVVELVDANGKTAEFWFDQTQVLLFLSLTLARCPQGDELSWVDLDQEIADLLDDPHGWRPGPGEVTV